MVFSFFALCNISVSAEDCPECYSKNSRITPLINPKSCLENHEQYVCGTCGRCICIQKNPTCGLRRWNFPFKTLEIAKLYLRTAEQCTGSPCGIYEINNNTGRKSYKIFATRNHLMMYLSKTRNASCLKKKPVFINAEFKAFTGTVEKLTPTEVTKYLSEMRCSVASQ
ncbi:MAG: hypothetical protein LBI55_00550 [Oscillospiraceae bacterium]|nr:hypothetical protein [Oscillospiraceae bacterium]